MSGRIDITGKSFGLWRVIRHDKGPNWICQCKCGSQKSVNGTSLRLGRSTRCMKCHTSRGLRRTHGERNTRLYNIWNGMIYRCENPKCDAYYRYGGRGISICAEWRSDFTAFRNWAKSNGYSKTLTIDRINNNGNYEPKNCRWATYAEQNRNYSRNRPIEYNGRTVLVCDLAKEVGIPQDVLKNRIFRYGWSVEKAVSTAVMRRSKSEPWKKHGMSRSAYYRALKDGRL